MNIYEIVHDDGEKEWVSGMTNIDALNTYVSVTECQLYDMTTSVINEVPREEWKTLTMCSPFDEKSTCTFEEWMENNHRSEIIAGTMYGD